MRKVCMHAKPAFKSCSRSAVRVLCVPMFFARADTVRSACSGRVSAARHSSGVSTTPIAAPSQTACVRRQERPKHARTRTDTRVRAHVIGVRTCVHTQGRAVSLGSRVESPYTLFRTHSHRRGARRKPRRGSLRKRGTRMPSVAAPWWCGSAVQSAQTRVQPCGSACSRSRACSKNTKRHPGGEHPAPGAEHALARTQHNGSAAPPKMRTAASR
jgi:hypothetical protein